MYQPDSDDHEPADEPADEKVGYKHPPKKHRFKKGRSGNPSGRPKKTAPPMEDFRRELSGAMLFKVSGKTRAFDSRKAYVRALVKSARKGSIADIKIILDLVRAGEFAAAMAAEQQRQCGFLIVPRPAATAEEWERRYGANAQDAAAAPNS